jgi:predicted membrane protein
MDGEYGTPIDLNVSNSAGSVDISLLGRWKANLEGTIKASAGSINLDLPRDVGVYVTADTSAGHVNSDGMKSAPGGAYVNDAYGSSPVTLRLDVSASAGNINLKLVD